MHSYSQCDALLSVKFEYAHLRITFEIYGGAYNSDNIDFLILTCSSHTVIMEYLEYNAQVIWTSFNDAFAFIDNPSPHPLER